MKKSYYFSEQEFNKCTPFCSMEDMEQDFLYLMDDIRRTFIHIDMGERVGLRPAIWVYDDNGNAV